MPGTSGRSFSRGDRSRAVWFGERYGGAGTDAVGPTRSSPSIRMVKLEHDPEQWRPVFRKSRLVKRKEYWNEQNAHDCNNDSERRTYLHEIAETILSGSHDQRVHRRGDRRHESRGRGQRDDHRERVGRGSELL